MTEGLSDGRNLSERGRRAAREMFGPDGPERIEAAIAGRERSVDADWARISAAITLNGLYSRFVLPTDVRELCAVAALTVLSHREELAAHIRIALHSNPPEKVREVILQMTVYGGVPVAREGLRLFDEAVAELGLDVPSTDATTSSSAPSSDA